MVGAGYVGLSMGVVLASRHNITLVDIDESKIAAINRGEAPIHEEGMTSLLQHAVSQGKLRAVFMDQPKGKQDVVMICVGTPSSDDGSVDLRWVRSAVEDTFASIDQIIDGFLAVGIKSTVPPGTTRKLILEELRGEGCQAKWAYSSTQSFSERAQQSKMRQNRTGS